MKQLVVLAALIALPLTASAGPKEKADAQAHIQKATAAHEAGDFNLALTELEAAYALDPQADLLYAIGQVHVKLNNCPVAISFYERFLATNPGPEPTSAAKEAITGCQTQLSAQPPPPEPEPAPPPPAPEPRKFDVIGTTLVGLGVISTIVGVVMYSSAINDLDDAEHAVTYQESESLVDDAQNKRNMAVIFGVAGVGAIAIGAAHYIHFRKSEQRRTSNISNVAVSPTRDGGGMITYGGSF